MWGAEVEDAMVSDSEMLDWIEEHRPQILRVRESECIGDVIVLDTVNGEWRGKTLRDAVRSAIDAAAEYRTRRERV